MAATPASGGGGAYSCETAERTREWMEALADFLRHHRPLLEAHVVNFFKVLIAAPPPPLPPVNSSEFYRPIGGFVC